MAESTAAKQGLAVADTIRIIIGSPPQPQNSSVAINGQVYFICTQICWVWTLDSNGNPINAFVGEQNGYLVCQPGSNGPFTPNVPVGTMITIAGVLPGNPPPSEAKEHAEALPLSVRGTIHITASVETK